MKLRNRLMAALTLVTASVLGVSFVSVYLFVQRDELQALDQSLLNQAHAAAEQVRRGGPQAVAGRGTAEVPEMHGRTQRYVVVYGENGTILSTSRSFDGPSPRLEDLPLDFDEDLPIDGVAIDLADGAYELRGVIVPVDPDRTLLYAATRSAISEDVRFLVRLLPALFVIALAATALLARWLGELLAKDVGAISSVANAAANGNLDARVGAAARGSTETRALAAALDDMIERLGALVTAQRHFITHAAHELRSPLATLRGELQLALRRPREPSEYRRALEEILHDTETLSTMTEDLLTLARASAAPPQPDATATALVGDVIDNAVWMAKGLAAQRRANIEIEPAPRLAVRGLAGDLARCLRNLIDNALHYGPPAGTVRIFTEASDDVVTISVSDHGPGIAPDDLSRIFAPFQRGRRTRGPTSGGAGLGLAIAREIARSYGGDVTFEVDRASGACVLLSMQRAPTPSGDPAEETDEPRGPARSRGRAPARAPV